MRKTWKKALACLCAAAVLVTGVNWSGMTVNAEEASTTNVLLDESVKIVEYTGASGEGGGYNSSTIGGVISADEPDTSGNSANKWVSGSVLKTGKTESTFVTDAVTYMVIDLGENVEVTAESIELYWFNGAYGNNYKIETSNDYVVPENPDAMTRNNLAVGQGYIIVY